jgi:hypothetical protein
MLIIVMEELGSWKVMVLIDTQLEIVEMGMYYYSAYA